MRESMRGRLSIEDWYVIVSQLLQFRISSKTRKRKEHCIKNLKYMLRRFETGISKSHMRGENLLISQIQNEWKCPLLENSKHGLDHQPPIPKSSLTKSSATISPTQLLMALEMWFHVTNAMQVAAHRLTNQTQRLDLNMEECWLRTPTPMADTVVFRP